MSGGRFRPAARVSRRALLVAAVGVASLGAVGTSDAAAAAGSFGTPFTLVPAVANDLLPVQLAFSPTNALSAAFGVFDEDNPANSSGRFALAANGAHFGPAHTISDSQQVLALAYQGATPRMLVGNSPKLDVCCSTVLATSGSASGAGARHTVIRGLIGPAQAALVPAGQGMLAAVASEHGVWAAMLNAQGRYGPTRALNVRDGWPQTLAATALANGKTVMVWTARTSQFAPGPVSVYLAAGTATAPPSNPHITLGVAAGHTIDELAAAAHGNVPTVAWIESWQDAGGAEHSVANVEDLAGGRTVRTLSAATDLASGLTLASGPNGSEAIAFRTCTTAAGTCTVHAAVRHAGGFGPVQTLGAIDPTSDPAVTVGAAGTAIVGWLSGGSVKAAVAAGGSTALGAPVTVSNTTYATNLTAAAAPTGGRALLAWTQGTLNQSIVGSSFTASGVPASTGATGRTGASGRSGTA